MHREENENKLKNMILRVEKKAVDAYSFAGKHNHKNERDVLLD